MNDPFQSPRRRIARAKEHIGSLNVGDKAFFGMQPYARIVESDPDTGHETHKLKLTRQPPDLLADFAFDAVEALRSALDQAGYAAAVAGGATVPKGSYFPIADTPTGVDNVIKKKRCKDLPADILSLFLSFRPYKGGNDLIWALNKAANTGKHRLIGAVGATSTKTRWTIRHSAGFGEFYGPNWDRAKHEIILGVVEPGRHLQYNVDITFFVAFGEVEAVAGQPAVPILRAMTREVERIVLATEAECRRIGLIV